MRSSSAAGAAPAANKKERGKGKIMMLHLAVGAAALAVVAVCVLFVLNSHYHAGLLGNVGLCLIALVGASRAGDIVEHGLDARVTPQGALLWIGLALFLGRQAWRFMSRLRCA